MENSNKMFCYPVNIHFKLKCCWQFLLLLFHVVRWFFIHEFAWIKFKTLLWVFTKQAATSVHASIYLLNGLSKSIFFISALLESAFTCWVTFYFLKTFDYQTRKCSYQVCFSLKRCTAFFVRMKKHFRNIRSLRKIT